jgi:hypothetical protein
MTEEIHYDNDLFFIIASLQLLKNGLLLNLDACFKDYYVNDLTLIDKSLFFFQEELTNNPHLIKLASYTHTLSRAERMMVELITELQKGDTVIAKTFTGQEDMLETLSIRHNNQALALVERLKVGVDNYKEIDVISEQEMAVLLAPDL